MYSSVNTPSEPCSTPPGVDRQAKSDRMSVSHKETSASFAQLEYTDTGVLQTVQGYMIDLIETPRQTYCPHQ